MPDDLIEQASNVLASCRRVAVLTGAGVSAESGLSTFRGPGGMWRGRDAMSLATPEAFAADPELVWAFYNERRRLAFAVEPNDGHRALAAMQDGFELDLITQNVDGLHARAGSRDVIELHGRLSVTRCTRCGDEVDRPGEVLDALPTCDRCGGLLRPGVVWFGEGLPDDAMTQAAVAATGCEAMLVVGTSRVVFPAAEFALLARQAGAHVIEINPDAEGRAGETLLREPSATALPRLWEAVSKLRA